MRVRLFKRDENTGLPGDDLLDESVVITSSFDKGWLEVDLGNYNIRLTDPEFFLAFEWIMDKEDRKYLANDLLCFFADQQESLVKKQYEMDGELVTDTKVS